MSSSDTSRPQIGPSLPPHLQNIIKDDNSSTDKAKSVFKSYGPALPPSLQNTASCSSQSMLGDTCTNQETDDSDTDSSDSDDDNFVGPKPTEASSAVDSADAAEEIEKRAERMKRKLNGEESSDVVEREEWMLELPDRLGAHIGMGSRTFQRKSAPELGDRSGWTETPGGKKKPKKAKIDTTLQDEFQRKKDLETAKELEKYNKEKRKETLMAIHAKKKKKEKKKQKKKDKKKKKEDEKPERVPFDWERDMKIGSVDTKRARSLLSKGAADLASKFAASKGQQFL